MMRAPKKSVSLKRRINALVNLHGYTVSEARRKISRNESGVVSDYITRPSQITQRRPNERLMKRRKKNLNSEKGVFPNPIESGVTSRPRQMKHFGAGYYVEISGDKKSWRVIGSFPEYDAAVEYANAFNRKTENKLYIRVTV